MKEEEEEDDNDELRVMRSKKSRIRENFMMGKTVSKHRRCFSEYVPGDFVLENGGLLSVSLPFSGTLDPIITAATILFNAVLH